MREMDQGIKRIVQTHPQDVLQLALPGAEYLGPAPVDVAAEPQLVLDTLQRVRYHGVECLVDIEAEATPRPDIGRRCFEYGSRASVVHQLPVVSVVLWLERGGRRVRCHRAGGARDPVADRGRRAADHRGGVAGALRHAPCWRRRGDGFI